MSKTDDQWEAGRCYHREIIKWFLYKPKYGHNANNLMMRPFQLGLLCICYLGCITALTNPYLIAPMWDGLTQYLVFHSDLRTNFTMSRTRCIALGGELVDVPSLAVLTYLSERLHDPAFIIGFRGELLEGECAAIYPGSAVAVPEEGCQAVMNSICEVPIMANGRIDLGDTKLVKFAPEGEQGAIKENLHVIKHAFFKVNADSPDKVMAPPAGMVVTTHVTIYGSVETNPVLPCCRCCDS